MGRLIRSPIKVRLMRFFATRIDVLAATDS